MKKTIKIILGVVFFVILATALAGMYKFDYLASQTGYDVDGNKIKPEKTMHPSWDTDQDGINDCEKEGTCDHTINTTKPRPNEDYLGLTVDRAQELAKTKGVPFRVIMEDGTPLPATRDYRPGRINATIENGIVTSYKIEGKES